MGVFASRVVVVIAAVVGAVLAGCGGGGDAGSAAAEADAPAAEQAPAVAAPHLLTLPRSTRVDVGASAQFEVSVESTDGPVRYQWSRNDVPIEGAVAARLLTTPVEAGNDGDAYRVEVSNAWGTIVSPPAMLEAVSTRVKAQGAGGNDRWVDAINGNDGFPGTESKPYRTISKAIGVVPGGSTIWLKDGTWTSAIDVGLRKGAYGLNCGAPTSTGTPALGLPLVQGQTLRAVNARKAAIQYDSIAGLCVWATQVSGWSSRRPWHATTRSRSSRRCRTVDRS